MRKLFLIILTLLPLTVSAVTREINGICYDLTVNGKTAEVVSNTSKYTGEVTIPDVILYDGVEYLVTSVGESSFRDCTELTSVSIGSNVTVIQMLAFYGCSKLTSVKITGRLTTIDYGAFCGCESLESFIVPSSVTYIGGYAFYGCKGLADLYIPQGVANIGAKAFTDCSNLNSIKVESGNTRYDSRLNCNAIVETASNKLIVGCAQSIIPQGIVAIDDAAFLNCNGLTSITTPNSVSSIGSETFMGCANLTTIRIGTGITTISSKAFSNCGNLIDLYCYAARVPQTASDAFIDSNIENITLHVQNTSVSAYGTTYPWSNLKYIIGLDEVLQKCATPTIAVVGGRLTFDCETEGVNYKVSYQCKGIEMETEGSEVALGGKTICHVTVYATKEGYENSDTATCDVELAVGKKGDTNADGQVDVEDVVETVNIILGE